MLGKQLLSCALGFPSFLPLTFSSPVQLQFQVCSPIPMGSSACHHVDTPHTLCVQGPGCDLPRRPRPLASVPDLVPGTSSPSSVTKKPGGSHVPSAFSLIPSPVNQRPCPLFLTLLNISQILSFLSPESPLSQRHHLSFRPQHGPPPQAPCCLPRSISCAAARRIFFKTHMEQIKASLCKPEKSKSSLLRKQSSRGFSKEFDSEFLK